VLEKRESMLVIEVTKNGPLIVKNLNNLRNSKNEQIKTRSTIVLCRCGHSANKPYCDGTHSTINFSGDREIDKPLDKEKTYVGDKITIHDNRTICSHAATCVSELSSVFSLDRRPWIDANGADVDSIINSIKKCPSGALSYSIGGVHYRDHEREPMIRIEKNGPYQVTGNIELKHELDLQPPSKEHYALCRCGVSKNKPFCDGSHHGIGFKDEKN
jgi:CDGSH-type Zn-finger protein